MQDACRHGVEVRPPDVQHSDWEATLEGDDLTAVRLGLRQIAHLGEAAGCRIAAARPFRDTADVARRSAVDKDDLAALAGAGALKALSGHRREAAWAVAGTPVQRDLLLEAPVCEAAQTLPAPGEGADLVADYATLGLSLGRHPLLLLRGLLGQRRYVDAATLRGYDHNRPVRCAGIVTCRQRPGTAQVVFLTLEDETGLTNVIVHPRLAERQRREMLSARLLGVLGVVQREGEVIHLVAKRLVDHSVLLGQLATCSRDFH